MEINNSSQVQQQGDAVSISDCAGVIFVEENTEPEQKTAPKQKIPKRVLHFSDGDLVEYSEDETDCPTAEANVANIDPKHLDWMPWAWYQTSWVGSKFLNTCDYVGEALASFLGITSPKYQLEIDEYKRIQERMSEESAREDLEMGGWNERQQNNLITNPEPVIIQ